MHILWDNQSQASGESSESSTTLSSLGGVSFMDLYKSSCTDDHHRHRHHRQRPTSCRGLWSFLDTHDTCQTTITSIVVFTLPEAAARNRGHFIVWCLLRFLKILAFKVTSIMLQLLFQSITTFVVWSGPTWSSFVCWLQIIDSRFLRFSVFFFLFISLRFQPKSFRKC